MIKNILFDLDDTIFDFGKEEKMALSKTLQMLKIPVTEENIEKYSTINLALWKQLEKGMLTREEVKIRRFEEFFHWLGVNVNETAKRVDEYYRNELGQHPTYLRNAKEVLEELQGKARLYLVTNGAAATQKKRIEKSGAGDYFEDIFISEELGYHKPQAAFFSSVFERIPDFWKEETVIVGDSLTSDIAGGIQSGIKTVWYHWKEEKNRTMLSPDFEITDLKELVSLFSYSR